MKIRFILFFIFLCLQTVPYAQSGLVLGGGISLGYTDNPLTAGDGKVISGFHVSLNGRFGQDIWYLRPGLELHILKLEGEKLLDPFSDKAAMYVLKVPAQIGLRLIKTELFSLRLAGGFVFSYVTSIQENSISLNHDTVTDTQFGSLIGLGIDLGPICLDLHFEKALTELYKDTDYSIDYFFITAGIFF